jgi:hypothetical protein
MIPAPEFEKVMPERQGRHNQMVDRATKRKLVLGYVGAVCAGVALQIAGIPFGTTLLSLLIALPILLLIVWGVLTGQQ